MILLSDEEIRDATCWDYLSGDELILLRQSNKAQLKAVVEWLDSDCKEHPKVSDPNGKSSFYHHEDCPQCWLALRREIE